MNIELTIQTILELFGALAIIAGGVKAISYLANPFRQIKDRLERHDELFGKDKRAIENLQQSTQKSEEKINAIGLAISELINHEITGNDIDSLKQRQRELNELLLK